MNDESWAALVEHAFAGGAYVALFAIYAACLSQHQALS
jgi:hypothetical protein